MCALCTLVQTENITWDLQGFWDWIICRRSFQSASKFCFDFFHSSLRKFKQQCSLMQRTTFQGLIVSIVITLPMMITMPMMKKVLKPSAPRCVYALVHISQLLCACTDQWVLIINKIITNWVSLKTSSQKLGRCGRQVLKLGGKEVWVSDKFE